MDTNLSINIAKCSACIAIRVVTTNLTGFGPSERKALESNKSVVWHYSESGVEIPPASVRE
jgi:hypothetical protein